MAFLAVGFFAPNGMGAVAGGSISGTVRDSSAAVIPGARITLVNSALGTEFKRTSDGQGFYSFPALAVGRYEISIAADGFKTQNRANLAVDADSALRVDATLEIAEKSEIVTVSESNTKLDTQVDTTATHLGEVVSEAQIASIPLNGRAYTDLLAIQPGVIPISTLTQTSVIMAGVTGTINPSGDLNPGNVSIAGQRESANGFMVNGVDVQEHMNGGTSVIPNLDSIEEFRVLTTNFDPEYGNYNGGMINVITKTGSGAFHGNAFEFLRNTDLDAKNFFDASRGAFRQNQYGGSLGGPIRKQSVFFFTDFQGTNTAEGITSPVTTVLSAAERTGNFSDAASTLAGKVSGPYLADLLTQKLGYGVVPGEPYYMPGCTAAGSCVFPNALIPQNAWSAPAVNLLKYIPQANSGTNLFSTSAFPQTVRDDKGSARIDANTRFGQISGYYFIDNYRLDNPYPGAQGGASVPGFNALTIGQAQMFTVGDTKVIGAATVNEFHAGFLRNANNIGQPRGGLGVTLASQGFTTGAGTQGIVVQAPQFEGVENITFPSLTMGVPISNLEQWNNTLYLSDAVSLVKGAHTLKIGAQFHIDQVNENPNATFNGTFNFSGTETGSAFADFLIGVPSSFQQTTGQHFYLRNHYAGVFAEDSWRIRKNLTLNAGLRWDLIKPWSEKYNSLGTIVPGRQSVLYPDAPPGLVVAGDPGIPSTISPAKDHNFGPRIGAAYSPKENLSIRASYGMFYTAYPGLNAGIMYGVPPFGLTYLSPAPPLFATPFTTAASGTQNTNPYPFAFPPHGVSQSNPYTGFNWASVLPVGGDPYFYYRNSVPYTESYMFSIERQFFSSARLTLSYAGNQGHHLVVLVPANPGNPQACLAQPGCGPFGEDSYHTREGLGADYGSVTAQKSIGNSNYNALEANFRLALGNRATALFAYTYSKSIDDASNLGEQINPFNERATRVISSFDLKQDFVATYIYNFKRGFSVSGTTRFSTGFPVTLYDDSDRSLLGTFGNGVNNQLLDTPQVSPGPLRINTDPRGGQTAFNTALFAPETLGQLGNSARRFFYGPGIANFDVQVSKTIKLSESRSLDLRVEAFNVFNHAQFYGPVSVDGKVNDANFGRVVSAAAPRLVQLAVKFKF
ncbi:MAG TPA: TonB-dependent receptor [Bryobacteraceae bacterium]|nr:TonB-dependent receptor [Bryobacteraceae bacterium]